MSADILQTELFKSEFAKYLLGNLLGVHKEIFFVRDGKRYVSKVEVKKVSFINYLDIDLYIFNRFDRNPKISITDNAFPLAENYSNSLSYLLSKLELSEKILVVNSFEGRQDYYLFEEIRRYEI